MRVIPINQISLKTFPIDSDYLEITEQQYNDFLEHKLMFDKELKVLIPFDLKGLTNYDSENE